MALRLGSLLSFDSSARLYGGSNKRRHGYTVHYGKHFGYKRFHRNRVLEIGVGGYASRSGGGSLRILRDYFPFSAIVGMDLHDKQLRLGRRVKFVKGDQANAADLLEVVARLGGPPDIVIDDGSHLAGHAEFSFLTLFPLMPSGSLYAIEDLHTSYWPIFGGGLPAPDGTSVALSKRLIDIVQAADPTFDRTPDEGPRPLLEIPGVKSLHVYPGMLIVEKG